MDSFIDFIEERFFISINDEQPLKALSSIKSTEEGMVVLVNDEQLKKALSFIVFSNNKYRSSIKK